MWDTLRKRAKNLPGGETAEVLQVSQTAKCWGQEMTQEQKNKDASWESEVLGNMGKTKGRSRLPRGMDQRSHTPLSLKGLSHPCRHQGHMKV